MSTAHATLTPVTADVPAPCLRIGNKTTATIYLHEPPELIPADIRPYLPRRTVNGYRDWIIDPGTTIAAKDPASVWATYRTWREQWAYDIVLGHHDTFTALCNTAQASPLARLAHGTYLDATAAASSIEPLSTLAADPHTRLVHIHTNHATVRWYATSADTTIVSTPADSLTVTATGQLRYRGVNGNDERIGSYRLAPTEDYACEVTTDTGHRYPVSAPVAHALEELLTYDTTGTADAAAYTGEQVMLTPATWSDTDMVGLLREAIQAACGGRDARLHTLHFHTP